MSLESEKAEWEDPDIAESLVDDIIHNLEESILNPEVNVTLSANCIEAITNVEADISVLINKRIIYIDQAIAREEENVLQAAEDAYQATKDEAELQALLNAPPLPDDTSGEPI